jgi:hypothetical protein
MARFLPARRSVRLERSYSALLKSVDVQDRH